MQKEGCNTLLKATSSNLFIIVSLHELTSDENKFNKVMLSKDTKEISVSTKENSRYIILKSITKLCCSYYEQK